MQDKFSAETRIANFAFKYLCDIGAQVVQLVPPGGQARISVTFTLDGVRRTIFPDMLAIFYGAIWVGEMKPRFSIVDKRKLLKLKHSIDGVASVRDVISRNVLAPVEGTAVHFCLIHGDVHSDQDPDISQLCFDADGVVTFK